MKVLYIDIDTLRPDHLGCYGYGRDTSPNIDTIARGGVRFDNCYASDAPCLPSRAALATGRFGIHTGIVNHGGACADMRIEGRERDFRGRTAYENFPERLSAAGIYTSSISSFAERHGAWWFYAGFKEMHAVGRRGAEGAEEVTPTALKWLNDNARRDNWFLHLHYWDPHTPYRAPENFGNPFKNDPLPAWYTEEVLAKHQKLSGQMTARELHWGMTSEPYPEWPRQPYEVRNMSDWRKAIDGYDCGIKYVDSHVGQVLGELRKLGVLEDTVVIISSDHGENMGELGSYCEHGTADNITCRIPFIIKGPGIKQGHADKGLHYNLDFAPTIAELAQAKPAKAWDGRSFLPAVTQGRDCGREYLVLSQCAHVCQRSVRFDRWIYIRTYHDGYWLFPEEMLFDLERDPHEQNNAAGEHPDICARAAASLKKWQDKMMSSMEYDEDPLWTVMKEGGPYHGRGALAKYCERLKNTGRGELVPELIRRHPGEFK